MSRSQDRLARGALLGHTAHGPGWRSWLKSPKDSHVLCSGGSRGWKSRPAEFSLDNCEEERWARALFPRGWWGSPLPTEGAGLAQGGRKAVLDSRANLVHPAGPRAIYAKSRYRGT